jgi:uncharacterized protein
MSPGTAHQKVVFFVVSVITAAWLWLLSFRVGFRPPEWVAITVLMWIPGLVAVGLRVLFLEGFGDVGWKLGHWRFWLWAYLGPLALASLSILLGVLFKKIALAPHLADQTMLDALWFRLSWPVPNSSAAGLLWQRFVFVATIGMVPGYILAFGEELGWRGYLLPRLVRAAWPFPLALTGLVWGVWHFPLFFLTGYAHGAVTLSIFMFTVLTILFGIFIGWLRLASGSVFVAAMAHASFNGFVQSFYGTSLGADQEWFWIGDYGLFVLVPYLGLATWLCWSGRLDARRAAAQSAIPR